MSDERLALGAEGEERATAHLKDGGWEILERNWRCRAGELDVIASRPIRRGKGTAQLVVFVEVKTRRGGIAPKLSVTRSKRLRIVRLARWYLRERSLRSVIGRFDIIEVIWPHDASEPRIRHHEGVFDASGRARR